MQRSSRAAGCALAVLTGLVSLGATCVPNPNERPATDLGPPDPPGPMEVGFAQIEADLKMKCGTGSPACHSPAASNAFKIGSDPMANFQLVKMFINQADPAQSVLLQKGLGMPSHQGGAALESTSSVVYRRWLQWIQDGFVFDPTQRPVTFKDIEKDMKMGLAQMGCNTASVGCHSPAAANRLKIGEDRGANYQLVKTFLNLTMPAESPLLQKALGQQAHGGGPIFEMKDKIYMKWLGWIRNMAPEK